MEGESGTGTDRRQGCQVRRAARLAAWPVALVFGGTVAVAEAPANSPARFLPDAESLEANIIFPELAGEIAEWTNCTAIVLGAGRIFRNWCFVDGENSAQFKHAIHTAVRELRLRPATVDGKPVRALMNYRVLFLSTGDTMDVRVFQNWGYDAPRLGNHYLGPQRYSYFHEYPSTCKGAIRPIVARVTVIVDAAGHPLQGARVDFADGSGSSSSCARALRRLHESAKYIPAEHDGTPVDAAYTELWGNLGRIALEPGG